MVSERSALGRSAEDFAADYLEQLGFVILSRNVKVGYLEVDIVARDGPVIAIVEVRTRGAGAWTSALGSVTAAKRQRIRRAGDRLWQRHYKQDPSIERLRFDIVAVQRTSDGFQAEHVPAAF